MAQKLNRTAIETQADVYAFPPQAAAQAHVVDRTFELPAALYGATVACYLGFAGLTAAAFGNIELIVPMAIIVFFIVAGFGVPTIWTKLAPDSPVKSKGWARFQRDGIKTLTGHNTAGQATVQVLILPALILAWGVAVVTIAALVR